MSEQSFTISVPDAQLDLLKRKLELTRLPDELEGAGWDYGVPRADVERILGRWKDGYDWRAEEAALNKDLPMFTRDIAVEGHGPLNVHYVHQKSAVAGAIPLLFVHGWPGSFIEVRKILPLLVTPDDSTAPAFHLVALGLPGYGFSKAAKKPGFGPNQMAETGHKLMLALGYDEYVCQGGDWGALITMIIAHTYGPKYAKAWHTNLPEQVAPSGVDEQSYSERDRAALERKEQFMETGSGYMREQSTKPQTLGFSLSDSPVGLLAWIYEKLVEWTDAYAWTDDEVLTWISIYWFSRAGPTASTRLYYEARVQGYFESQKRSQALLPALEIKVPVGLSFFPKELIPAPESWISPHGEVAQAVQHERGGHFAAYEVPELLVDDLRKMFGKDGPAYGVVKSHDGY
ncbi:alpha/beta-hydrolase [Peniophora sp. CONT]|nr:alpha/beta-hydrolase [Peniophora sp. CONT]